jgi:hydroxymethylbilane synthase
MSHTLIIGTRDSPLALWQAEFVRDRLVKRFRGLTVELALIKTKGDKILDQALSKIGDKGLFTKEIENALLDRRVDIAVHSLKDLPTETPDGLRIAAITARE